jgi:hypothetical protein
MDRSTIEKGYGTLIWSHLGEKKTMLSSFKDPYANAPDEYYNLVLEKYVPPLEHPLPPIPQQHIPANYASNHPAK